MMKNFFAAILCAYFVAEFANSSVQPTKTTEAKKAPCNVNNYNSFYAGPNCKNIEQRLAKINTEIEALKGNKSSGPGDNGLFSELKQQLTEIKQEIKALKENLTGGSGEIGLSSEVKQQLSEIKQEIRGLEGNRTVCCGEKGLYLLFRVMEQVSSDFRRYQDDHHKPYILNPGFNM